MDDSRSIPPVSNENMSVNDEDLVAFLDGELPNDHAEAIRALLTKDPALQRKATELQKSWDLLDCLPESSGDEKLAESTIELVALKLQEDQNYHWTHFFKRFAWPICLSSTLLALLAGVAFSKMMHWRESQDLLTRLPLLTRFSDLQLIDSPQWLEKLAAIDSLVEAGLPLYQKAELPSVPKEVGQLKVWIDGLDPVQRLRLYEEASSFNSLPIERQERLLEIDEMLNSTSPHDYSKIVKAYAGLTNQAIGSAELAQLEANKNLEERAASLTHVVNRELAIAYANRLSETEKQRIRYWSNGFMEKHLNYFLELEDPDSEIILLLDVPSTDSVIQVEDVRELIDCIEPTGQALLDRLDEYQKMKSLRLWVYTASPINRNRPQYSPEELQERFSSLPVEQQNRLIYLPSSEAIKTLTEETTSSDD